MNEKHVIARERKPFGSRRDREIMFVFNLTSFWMTTRLKEAVFYKPWSPYKTDKCWKNVSEKNNRSETLKR